MPSKTNLEVWLLLDSRSNEIDSDRDGSWISHQRLGHSSRSGFSDAPPTANLPEDHVLKKFYF